MAIYDVMKFVTIANLGLDVSQWHLLCLTGCSHFMAFHVAGLALKKEGEVGATKL
jgi:hypothetical protein